ncbi:MAG: DUF2828 family protein [Oscillospiraceae bacterium]|nr:DUF2828 family protein [Oscillospiraceae bacterium]
MEFLTALQREADLTCTENGALTHTSSGTDCLDLFFRAGGMRAASENDIAGTVIRAYTEDPARTMKILFYIRDARGGLGERRFFRIAMQTLAQYEPEAVRRNIRMFAEYGRYDDLCALLGTACEPDALTVIRAQLDADRAGMERGEPVSLLAKWLPSVNASAAETRANGRKVAAALDLTEKQYRQTLSALRKYTDIIENRLRERDYTFDYAKQASRAMFKYRKAFIRNDGERYQAYLGAVERGEAIMHADVLYPYDIVRACGGSDAYSWVGFQDLSVLTAEERRSLDAAWNALPVFGDNAENALAVVDGSGSMYMNGASPRPIDAALSLGIYFAEHTKGAFAGHFITFSARPKLVKIKGRDIAEKVHFCASYDDVANTDLEAVFDLILRTAVNAHLPQSDLPAKLYIISDMEFDAAVQGGNQQTLFDAMRSNYAAHGYTLPEIVFWNVASRHQNIPVSRSQTGAALVSGASPAVFDMVIGGEVSPEIVMEQIIGSERYARIS